MMEGESELRSRARSETDRASAAVDKLLTNGHTGEVWPGVLPKLLAPIEIEEIKELCETHHPHTPEESEVWLALHAMIKHAAAIE